MIMSSVIKDNFTFFLSCIYKCVCVCFKVSFSCLLHQLGPLVQCCIEEIGVDILTLFMTSGVAFISYSSGFVDVLNQVE